MSEPQATPTTRRIAVALDASEQSQRVIALTAGIAAVLRAELEGVFIEDIAVLRAVGLPFQREFRLTSRGEARIDSMRMARELRASARGVRALLEASAQRVGCRWSFRAWRGDLEAEILSAASSADMFALRPLGRFAPFARPRQPGQRTAAAQGLRVGALWDGSEGALRAIAAGAELAASGHARLQIFMQAADAAAFKRLDQQLPGAPREAKGALEVFPLAGASSDALIPSVIASHASLLMVDAGNPLLQRERLWQRLAALHCPLLSVR